MNPKKLLIIITILLVSFCVQFTLKAEPIDPQTQHYLRQAQNYLALADSNAPPQAYQYELLAADSYIRAGALDQAQPLLEILSYSSLPRSLKTFKDKLDIDFALKLKQIQVETTSTSTSISNDKYTDTPTPSRIALLLPLTGTHAQPAQAIKAGFLEQYQANMPQKGAHPIQVKLYDTSQTSDICALYNEAVRDGANFVIGPLIKDEVFKLSQLAQSGLPVPILALNMSPEIKGSPINNFFQFALSPEEEAQHLAQKAWMDGHRSTSIVVPDNEWGKRVLNAFSTKWQDLGGKIPSTALINNKQNPDAAIRKLLQVAINAKPPYRRQDIDMIVLAAPPEQARQLRPLLDFYYANNLKVYATSSVYQGKPQPQQDRDLNGVIFCDMPWILENRQDNEFNSLARLYAMGLDAYQLISRVNSLNESPNTQYHGATGILSIGPNHTIERELSWAQIKDGVPHLYAP